MPAGGVVGSFINFVIYNIGMVRTKVEAISKETLLEINKINSDQGVRSEADLDYIVYKMARTRGLNRKVALLLIEIAQKHPFYDGNKRTAFESAVAFLSLHNKKLKVGDKAKLDLVFRIANRTATLEEVALWIANHTR